MSSTYPAAIGRTGAGIQIGSAPLASCAAITLALLLGLPPDVTGQELLPNGVEQLLPRGRIAAVTEPKFVAASLAEIADDAWVLGVEIDGEARAYSLNLLNAHEVVNDRIGEKSFAAVW